MVVVVVDVVGVTKVIMDATVDVVAIVLVLVVTGLSWPSVVMAIEIIVGIVTSDHGRGPCSCSGRHRCGWVGRPWVVVLELFLRSSLQCIGVMVGMDMVVVGVTCVRGVC
jgi:hypothetical protein